VSGLLPGEQVPYELGVSSIFKPLLMDTLTCRQYEAARGLLDWYTKHYAASLESTEDVQTLYDIITRLEAEAAPITGAGGDA
jgi:hypothetical protein